MFTAATTSHSSSPPTSARPTAAAERRGARPPQRGVRSAARLPLRRFRQPPAQARDPRGVAGTDRPHDRRGARDRAPGARRDRAGPMAASIDPYLVDWLDLVFRWFHVIAAIVWIGTSFYFVALDSHLVPPEHERDRERGVGGETWEIHGGGFYRIE